MSKARPLPLNSSHATDPGDKQVARQSLRSALDADTSVPLDTAT